MADDDPSATGDAPALPKKETVRITLPPNPQETPMVKRETVRINTPGPKKETTSIGGAIPLPATPPPAPATPTRPLAPPPSPPRPPSAPGLPSVGARPSMPPPTAPRPAVPSSAPKPGVPPMAPRPAAPVPAAVEARPVSIKAAPKKETARIQVSPTSKLPPQATVRLNQPPPSQLAAGPAPALRMAAPVAAATVSDEENDPIMKILSFVAVAFSLIAAALSYLAWSTQ